MEVYKEHIIVKSHGKTPTFINITSQIRNAIKYSQIKDGIVVITTPHTTCSIFFEEFVHDFTDEGTEFLQVDLNNTLKKIIPDQTEMPPEGPYLYPGEKHFKDVETWPNSSEYLPNGDRTALLNCDAHLKSTILGSNITLEVDKGNLAVGSTGYVYFVDFDRTRERTRKCSIIILGK